ncbi:putative chitinase 10 like protein [Argiope bruennichi]|uniref:Putative chitinase 10 like protein n=2 Tax=Argiope bruennichi TaxID=94029 RepID=A0A8T0EI91_ARGBR|nr:putative chitinase 10 like protein [Argiope bruennichi]
MLLSVLKIMILQFIAIEGQMAPNPYTAGNSRPAYLTPNTPSEMGRNPYPSTRNSELGSNHGNYPQQDQRYPTDINSNVKDSPHYNSNNNNPTFHNSYNNPPNNFNPYNDGSPDFNSDDNRSPDFNPNNNRSPDFNPNRNRSPEFYPNNNRSPDFNPINNRSTVFNPYSNRSPEFYPNNNRSPDFNPNSNRSPDFNSNHNRSPVFNPNNNRSPEFNRNSNRSPDFNPNNNRSPDFNPNNNRSPVFNPNSNRSPDFNPSNNRSPDFNSNDNYNPGFSGNSNQNTSLKSFGAPKNRQQGERKSLNDEYPKNDSQEGQSDPDPYTTNHPSDFLPNNDYPSNNSAPKNYNPAHSSNPKDRPKFPFYIYYQTDPLKSGRIVCLFNIGKYLKSGFQPTMIPARLCTIVNYEFAKLNSTTYEISPGNPDLDYGQNFYNKTVGLKYFNPYLKVMLSLGGWTDSTKKYSDLVASTKKVNNFITKAVQFLKNHGFDGLDIAWEYPNCWQGALGVSPQDKPNFAKFLKKIRKAFDDENLLLSISVSAIKREIKAGYNGTEIAKAVHYVNVMTYDMHGPWEKMTGHHTQFDKKANDSDPTLNSKAAMEYWASIGVPKIKLNMGIATYATTFTLKNPMNHKFGAPATGPGKAGALSHSGGTLYYREICQYINAGNWTEEQDKDVGYYAYSGDQWAGYDHPLMVVRKVKWIAESGYGGLLIKDVGGDDYETKCFAKKFPLIWIAGMEFTRKLKGKK